MHGKRTAWHGCPTACIQLRVVSYALDDWVDKGFTRRSWRVLTSRDNESLTYQHSYGLYRSAGLTDSPRHGAPSAIDIGSEYDMAPKL